MKIAVIGAGGWGTALSVLLSSNHQDVVLWCHRQEMAEELKKTRENKEYLPGVILPLPAAVTSSFEEALKGAGVVVLVTPSSAIEETCNKLKPFLDPGAIVVIASKGLADNKGHRLSEMVEHVLEIPPERIAAISGPNHAEEVGRGLPAATVVASTSDATSRMIQDLFMSLRFRVYRSNDIVGVEYGGALKNIIALACGILDGLHLGDNCRAALITRGLVEITRFGVHFGAHMETFFGLSGMGDLIVTCTSTHSRNHQAGMAMAGGRTKEDVLSHTHMVVEGVRTAELVHHIAEACHIDMPITQEVFYFLEGKHTVKEAAENLMTRSKKSEPDGYLSLLGDKK